MSRNFIPAVLAIGVGVVTGYYTFQPAFKELQSGNNMTLPQGQSASQRSQDQKSISSPAPAPSPTSNAKEGGSGK